MHGIVIALSIAVLGAATVGFYGMQQIEAAKSGVDVHWCYNNGVANLCFTNHGECNKAQSEDDAAQGGCFKQKRE